ncbi:hypothetical protein UA08_07760 [Talaromyces atroroseus]|uniref:Uncharacterized protein n=1 Tax=Talaromyces atroroseus TaxID=1441469 RepID=A0A225AIC3_TALAT|nr:hypothetical protein UA08_07760 [Talaromyces atroroseus]OKL56878.1 hypothetical protein UA08_07760 [Talaromyces atroroseus]
MLLSLPESLPSLVSRRFVAAKESGALIFSATQLAVLRARNNGVEYQLRYCPALAKKPGQDRQKKKEKEDTKRPDPFDNPAAALLIADIPSTAAGGGGVGGHLLILNKFPVIANHFILATRLFEPQTDLLGKHDLEAAFACVRAWRAEDDEQKRLFAFFNSGVESGASQPHRHLQFLPVEDMRASSSSSSGVAWRPLIDLLESTTTTTSSQVGVDSGFRIRHLPTLPFQHFAISLSEQKEEDLSADVLHAMYLSLYRAALVAAGISDVHELHRASGPAAISYNLAMTEEVMMLCPRRRESGSLHSYFGQDRNEVVEDGKEDDVVSLNGTILAGTLMVKSEEQWDRIRGNAEVINSLLAEVGIPYT